MPNAPATQELRFEGNILATNGSDQLAALKTLLNELKGLDGEINLASVEKVAKHLVDSRVLKSRDGGVQAYGACCLNEILKIYAPNAPYTTAKLGEIFNLFIKQFRHLSNPEHPYFQQIHMLIETMVQIHVIALACDLSNAQALITTIFNMFYQMANENELVPGMDILMTSILSQIVEYYTQPLPQEVINLVLSNFLNYPKQSKDVKNTSLPLKVPVGFTMSKTLCADNVDVMVRYTNQYFSDLLHPRDGDEDEGDEDEDIEDYDEESQEPHRNSLAVDTHNKTTTLLVEIWKAVPELLEYVVGQLQQDLQIDDLKLRTLATESIGQMIVHTSVRGDFVRDHWSAYSAWLNRVKDRSYQVRLKWTECAGLILENRQQVSKELVENFVNRFDDTDERVRIKACDVAGGLSISTAVNRIAPYYKNDEVLGTLSGRLRDKKAPVRSHGFVAAGKLYNKSYDQDGGASGVFNWVPSRIFEQLYLNDKAVNELIDETEFEYLFPRDSDDNSRAVRLLAAMKELSEQGYKSFEALCKRQVETARYVNLLLTSVKKVQEDGMNEPLNKQLNALKKFFGEMFSNGDRVGEAINYLVERGDKQLCKLISNCVNPECDYKQVTNSIKEIFKRVPAKHEPVFKQFLYRTSYLLYNKSILAPIVELSRTSNDTPHAALSTVAHTFLKQIAGHCPVLLKTQAERLTQIIQTSEPGQEGNVDTLKAASLLFNKTSENFPQDSTFMKALYKLSTQSTPKEAKQAVKMFAHSARKEMYYDKLLEEIIARFNDCDTIERRDEANITTKLSALAQLCMSVPESVEAYQDIITRYLIKNFVLVNENPKEQDDYDESGPIERITDDQLDHYLQRKILALQVFVNRLRAHEGYEGAQDMAKPLFKMLLSLIGNCGEISKQQDTPWSYRVRLRLDAGLKLLKLARIPTFDKMIRAQDLNKLALLLQEENLEVRSQFVRTLTRYLSLTTDQLPHRYLALVFLMAYEADDDLYNHVTTWIRAQFARQQTSASIGSGSSADHHVAFEKSFARLLSLLAHHQDYFNDKDRELEDLQSVMQYLLYYLTLIANSDNLSLIFYMGQRVKQFRDYDDDEGSIEESNRRLYLMSDFSQFLILKYRDFKTWTLETWPGKVSLPADAFSPMPDAATSKQVSKTLYLDENLNHDLEQEMKRLMNPKHHHHHHQTKKVEEENEEEHAHKLVDKKEEKVPSKRKKSSEKTKPKVVAQPKPKSAPKGKTAAAAENEDDDGEDDKEEMSVDDKENEGGEDDIEEEEEVKPQRKMRKSDLKKPAGGKSKPASSNGKSKSSATNGKTKAAPKKGGQQQQEVTKEDGGNDDSGSSRRRSGRARKSVDYTS